MGVDDSAGPMDSDVHVAVIRADIITTSGDDMMNTEKKKEDDIVRLRRN